jgi:hypothetical protein
VGRHCHAGSGGERSSTDVDVFSTDHRISGPPATHRYDNVVQRLLGGVLSSAVARFPLVSVPRTIRDTILLHLSQFVNKSRNGRSAVTPATVLEAIHTWYERYGVESESRRYFMVNGIISCRNGSLLPTKSNQVMPLWIGHKRG